jgi:hypothetical protein
MSAEPLAATLRRLLGPGEPEIACEACFARLDLYVDAEVRGGDADAAVPGMRAHLSGCEACAEEHESLKALVSTSQRN